MELTFSYPCHRNICSNTNIGSDPPDDLTFSRKKTNLINKLLAERAYRWIFSRKTSKESAQE